MVRVLIGTAVMGTLATRALGAILATALGATATLLGAQIVVVAWLASTPLLAIARLGTRGFRHPAAVR